MGDDILVRRSLVFDDDGASIFVEPQCVNPTFRDGELTGEKANAEKDFEIFLKLGLNRLLDRVRGAGKLVDLPVGDTEKLNVAHAASSRSQFSMRAAPRSIIRLPFAFNVRLWPER